ncbi:MAG: polyprenyl diphosphate synthase [Acidimicrobiia bacterium]
MRVLSPLLLRPAYRLYERRLLAGLDRARLPGHIGIILDGHRRFARAEGLPDYTSSYRAGMRRFDDFLGWCRQLEVPAVTGWLLSKENLARPRQELDPYYDVLIEFFAGLPSRARELGLTVRFIGSLDLLPVPLAAAAKAAEEASRGGSRRLTIALGYGGRQEIVDACRELVAELVAGGTPPEDLPELIDAGALAAHLYTSDLPDPDLVIRTSGEARLSGFLLWQSAFAEFVFVDVFWPAFRRVDFLRALRDYGRRDRRFGR